MKRSLKSKVILSYLAVALITVLVVSALIRLTSGQSLMNLVVEQQTAALSESVISYYDSNGNLTGFAEYYFLSLRAQPPEYQPGIPDDRFEPRDIRGVHGLVDAQGYALIPSFEYQVGQLVPEVLLGEAIPVPSDGEVIAYILPDTKFQFKLSAEEEIFLQRTNLAIALAAVAGVLVALGMGYLLAGGIIKPIRRLTKASQALAQGQLDQQVPVTSQDEIGQLTSTFNHMSADLLRADQQRKRLTADITHDLSTPLQVISGYIEMLEEGEVDLTPQRFDIIKTEIEHLRRLVGDLSTLTQVEAGGLEMQLGEVQPAVLLEKVYNAFQPIAAHQGVSLALDIAKGLPLICVDEGRMLQVLKNLLENALRYTPLGGEIRLAAQLRDKVEISVCDNGAGIEPEDLPFVFERFYKADKTRGANAGKMGLGLAICKALVVAQGGEITAHSEGKDQGTCMRMRFEDYEPSK